MALTPQEFQAAADVYRENREAEFRGAWERARMVASASIAPHTRRSAKSLFPLPWDSEKPENRAKKLTRAERERRMRELEERWG